MFADRDNALTSLPERSAAPYPAAESGEKASSRSFTTGSALLRGVSGVA